MMTVLRVSVFCVCLAGLFVLSGCGGTAKKLGLVRTPPDEFAVSRRAPLTLPPDYHLRPPGESTRSGSAAAASREEAAELVFGQQREDALEKRGRLSETDLSETERMILNRAGSASANPEIRAILAQESPKLSASEPSVVERLLFWDEKIRNRNADPGEVLDPESEVRRLRKREQNGTMPDNGDEDSPTE